MDTYASQTEALRQRVYEANMRLYRSGLVPLTFGNVSEKIVFDGRALIAIKPSGVPYDTMRPEHIVLVDEMGKPLEQHLRPSSDTPTHALLYRELEDVAGVTHTHSTFATSWSQAGCDIPLLGTTHADYGRLAIPCTPQLSTAEIEGSYEENTGAVIVRCLRERAHLDCKMVIVKGHGPFTMGKNADQSVEHAIALEEIAKMAYHTVLLNPRVQPLEPALIAKHYNRKHGSKKYYGQN